MRQAIVVVLGFLALLSFTTNVSAQTSYHSAALGITFPAELGGLRFVRTTDFEPRQRGLGVGVYYNNPSPFIAVDIFIYDKTERVPSGYEPAAIKAEGTKPSPISTPWRPAASMPTFACSAGLFRAAPAAASSNASRWNIYARRKAKRRFRRARCCW